MTEQHVYERQGFGQTIGLGDRIALVLVDFIEGFVDPDHFGGGNIADAVENTHDLLCLARELAWPIAHTRIVYAEDGVDAGAFARKVPGLLRLTEHNPLSRIVPSLTPRPDELVIRKTQPSAFFGTGLATWLAWRHVDTLVVTGCTTSGCVRATVVDAVGHNLRTIVPADCVGDRAMDPHQASLFDMQQKYADVLDSGLLRTMIGHAGRMARRLAGNGAAGDRPDGQD